MTNMHVCRRLVTRESVVHLNAAVVPRHRAAGEGLERYFLRVCLAGGGVEATDLWVDDDARVAVRQPLAAAG